MANEPTPPPRQTLEEQARQLLDAARQKSGSTVDDIVKTLGGLQPRGAETRRSWYDWLERPETISLLTGLASMHLLGPQETLRLVFGEDAAASEGSPTAPGIAALETATADVAAEVALLREQVRGFVIPELEKQAELMAKLLAERETETADVESPPGQTRRRSASG